ncbi:MAG: FKBP-type peptidyl-prolyl cis-trans isomerase [Rikenellaceae bacterium]|jgi:FKBP-type peptidyl-prolyl cis-trans isomerase|nr:FKBP-type peptidyl-prolyl cis-trans isomerase [Rikenellaceae bacterium]
MKRITGIFALLILLAWGGCSKVDYDIEGQQTRFTDFITNGGWPFYEFNGVYQVVVLRGAGPAVAAGDSIYFSYTGSSFTGSVGPAFATNIKEKAKEANLDTTRLDFRPKGFRSGDGSLMPGLASGLTDCRQGDSLLVLITSDLAYGDKQVGYVPAGTPVVFEVSILKVIK